LKPPGSIAEARACGDLYLGPTAPAGEDKNWLRTVPGKGYFTILQLYGPTEPFFNQTWKPGDIEKVR